MSYTIRLSALLFTFPPQVQSTRLVWTFKTGLAKNELDNLRVDIDNVYARITST